MRKVHDTIINREESTLFHPIPFELLSRYSFRWKVDVATYFCHILQILLQGNRQLIVSWRSKEQIDNFAAPSSFLRFYPSLAKIFFLSETSNIWPSFGYIVRDKLCKYLIWLYIWWKCYPGRKVRTRREEDRVSNEFHTLYTTSLLSTD